MKTTKIAKKKKKGSVAQPYALETHNYAHANRPTRGTTKIEKNDERQKTTSKKRIITQAVQTNEEQRDHDARTRSTRPVRTTKMPSQLTLPFDAQTLWMNTLRNKREKGRQAIAFSPSNTHNATYASEVGDAAPIPSMRLQALTLSHNRASCASICTSRRVGRRLQKDAAA